MTNLGFHKIADLSVDPTFEVDFRQDHLIINHLSSVRRVSIRAREAGCSWLSSWLGYS